jgi:hypothetical protein
VERRRYGEQGVDEAGINVVGRPSFQRG